MDDKRLRRLLDKLFTLQCREVGILHALVERVRMYDEVKVELRRVHNAIDRRRQKLEQEKAKDRPPVLKMKKPRRTA